MALNRSQVVALAWLVIALMFMPPIKGGFLDDIFGGDDDFLDSLLGGNRGRGNNRGRGGEPSSPKTPMDDDSPSSGTPSHGGSSMGFSFSSSGGSQSGASGFSFGSGSSQIGGQVSKKLSSCANNKVSMGCRDSSHVIRLENVFYGRVAGDTRCPNPRRYFDNSCTINGAFASVMEKCNGKTTCNFKVEPSEFGKDTCRRVSKYIEIEYRCVAPGDRTIGLCLPNIDWTDWVSTDKPGSAPGDMELLAEHEARNLVCKDGQKPIGIQVQNVATGQDGFDSGEAIRTGLGYGASCTKAHQRNKRCQDYAVRYCCMSNMRRIVPPSLRPIAPGTPLPPVDPPSPTSPRRPIVPFPTFIPSTPTYGRNCRKPLLPNGRVTPSYKDEFRPGERAQLICNPGFILFAGGSSSITCLASGVWTIKGPSCQRDLSYDRSARYSVYQTTVCEGAKRTVSCANRQHVIYVHHAYFGRLGRQYCNFPPIKTTQCIAKNSLRIIKGNCEGKNSCELNPNLDVFGDPCLGTYKYAYMQYHCARPGSTTIGTCSSDTRWGQWMDVEDSDGAGDFELLTLHQQIRGVGCQRPTGMQVSLVDGGASYGTSGEAIRVGLDYGMSCTNEYQVNGKCSDYKVRYCCSGGDIGPTPPQGCLRPTFGEAGSPPIMSPLRDLYPWGSRISFSCKSSEKLEPAYATSSFCLTSGAWTVAAPVCTSKANQKKFCKGYGDPHYRSFDGKKFDFMGDCSYTFSQYSGPTLPQYQVDVENYYRGKSRRVTWLKRAWVRVYGIDIELNQGKIVTVNGERVNLPFTYDGGKVEISLSGKYVMIVTDFDLMVKYDGVYYIGVGVPTEYQNLITGLCGNYNDDPRDDFGRSRSAFEFGNAQINNAKYGCIPTNTEEDLCSLQINKLKYVPKCAILSDVSGPFRECLSVVEVRQYVEDCLFDLCAFEGALDALEHAITPYMTECQENDAKVYDWRIIIDVPMECPAHSTYSTCVSGCPKTCTNRNEDTKCDMSCSEGCQCDDGYVLSGDKCVLVSECGCSLNGRYYMNGEEILNGDCSEKCTCTSGVVSCVPFSCPKKRKCQLSYDGSYECGCTGKGLSGTCKAVGDPHYKTIDGSGTFDFMGKCEYTMSHTYKIPEDDMRWFHVTVKNEERHGRVSVSYVDYVKIRINNPETGRKDEIVLDTDMTAKINGQVVTGAKNSLYTLAKSGFRYWFKTKYGLNIWVAESGMKLKVSCNYENEVRGVCGDHNDNRDDDLLLADGSISASFPDFVESYKVGECSAVTPPAFQCDPEERKKWRSDDYCGQLKLSFGPFGECHGVVAFIDYFNNCVYDTCEAAQGGMEAARATLFLAFEDYASSCQGEGVPMCDWREDSGAPIKPCPANSRYSGCASACPNTCLDPYASNNCPLPEVEDCVCDYGYVLEAGRCILRSQCGCFTNGISYTKGSLVEITNAYTCTCLGLNKVDCVCANGYTGTGKNCADIDECNDLNDCDVNSLCENTDGSYTCTCMEGYAGNGKTCTAINCQSPIRFPNSQFKSELIYSPGMSVTYTCVSGYSNLGGPDSVTSTCMTGGFWTLVDITCIRIQCDVPVTEDTVTFGPEKTEYFADDAIIFICANGHKFSDGSSTTASVCGMDGQWSQVVTFCIDKRCPVPMNGQNSIVTTFGVVTLIEGNSVLYNCVSGYRRVDGELGSLTSTCKDNSWTEAPLDCIRIECDLPMSEYLNNVVYSPMQQKYFYEDIITYRCAERYRPDGQADEVIARCQNDGMWSSMPITCVDDSCPMPDAEQNGRIVFSGSYIKVGDTITQECLVGYENMLGPSINTLTCGEDNMIHGSNMQCVDINECLTDTPCGANQNCVNTDGSYRCPCMQGYLLINNVCVDDNECDTNPCKSNEECNNIPGGHTCNCVSGYRRMNPQSDCEKITCQIPVAPTNGFVNPSGGEATYLDEITFSCKNGFSIAGAATISCRRTGLWSASVPMCQDDDECSLLTHNCDANARCQNTDGSYDCFCKEDEAYYGNGRRCILATCEGPMPIDNGRYSPFGITFTAGRSITYTCNKGYELSVGGNSYSRNCVVDPDLQGLWDTGVSITKWEPDEPSCTEIDDCITNDCDSNARCIDAIEGYSCSCNEGYTGNGFICNEITCPRPTAPSNGQVVTTPLTVDSIAIYSCIDGYELMGLSQRVCQITGLWGGSRPICREINECVEKAPACKPNYRCENTPGAYVCHCDGQYRPFEDGCQLIRCDNPIELFMGNYNPRLPENVKYSFMQQVTFWCMGGYRLVGSPTSTCQASGEWSDEVRVCEDIDECLNPNQCGADANCRNFDGGFECWCDEGYNLVGNSCKRVRCPNAWKYSNSIILEAKEVYYYMDDVVYDCASGYEFSSDMESEILTCQIDGTWDYTPPFCVDINECDITMDNCDINANCINMDGTFRCECKPGYAGSGVMGDCTRVSCGDPEPLQYASFELTITESEYNVKYTCNDGYFMLGASLVRCTIFGKWSSSPPVCEDIDECTRGTAVCSYQARCINLDGGYRCECLPNFFGDGKTCKPKLCQPPITPQNARRSSAIVTWRIGSKVSYTCNQGFVLVGTLTDMFCQADLTWSASPACEDINECDDPDICHTHATCTNTPGGHTCNCNEGYRGSGQDCREILCSHPGTPANGNVVTQRPNQRRFKPGAEVSFTCATGYRLTGASTIICQSTETWSSLTPECVEINECDEGICSEFADCVNFAGGYSCTCKTGYEGNGINCKEIHCEYPLVPVNAMLASELKSFYVYTDEIEYSCMAGYELVGVATVRCTLEGVFSGFLGCRDINECANLPCDTNAQCENTDGGFNCKCNKRYSGDGFSCTEIMCPKPMDIDNGKIFSDQTMYRIGATVMYVCDIGYGSVIGNTVECDMDGTWKGSVVCQDINECEASPRPCDQNARCVNSIGSFDCQCDQGYRGNGFTCNRIRCPPPERVVSATFTLTDEKRFVNSVLTYVCNSGYAMEGTSTLTCLPKGQWSHEVPTCENVNECDDNPCGPNSYCVDRQGRFECICNAGYREKDGNCELVLCPVPMTKEPMYYETSSVELIVGSLVTYRCRDGYKLRGTGSVALCRNDATWSIQMPECRDINECNDNPCHRNAQCGNRDGGFSCSCNAGYYGNGASCTPITCNAPSLLPDYTQPAEKAVYQYGESLIIRCMVGYEVASGAFAYPCMSTDGFGVIDIVCQDIDECSSVDLNDCHEMASCSNFGGGYDCVCDDNMGYIGDGRSCRLKECRNPGSLTYGTITGEKATYVVGDMITFVCIVGYELNTDATARCNENGQWSISDQRCIDIDECSLSTDDCDVHATCTNTDGGYDCTCTADYNGDGRTCTIKECPDLILVNGIVSVTSTRSVYVVADTVTFECFDGYMLFGVTSAMCLNTEMWSENIPECKDIDECADDLHDCDDNADCFNNEPGYNCACRYGYKGDGFSCTEITCDGDIGELPPAGFLLDGPQDEYVIGEAITFACLGGYTLTGGNTVTCRDDGTFPQISFECKDDDECSTGQNNCDANASCKNIPGSYECECNQNYDGDGFSCVLLICPSPMDVNLASYSPSAPPSGSDDWFVGMATTYKCIAGYRLTGGPTISCQEGGTWSPDISKFVCENINECDTPETCNENARCEDQPGSVNCYCNVGYEGDGFTCREITCNRPTNIANGGIVQDGLEFSYMTIIDYECLSGYALQGNSQRTCQLDKQFSGSDPQCTDIDECSTGDYDCLVNEYCRNTDGSYECVCDFGYERIDGVCTRIECPGRVLDNGIILVNQVVVSVDYIYYAGDFVTYACMSGYMQANPDMPTVATCQVDGTWSAEIIACFDINECADDTMYNCPENSNCANTDGSYNCNCNYGYKPSGEGDALECIEIMCPEPMPHENGGFKLLDDMAEYRLLDGRIEYICELGYRIADGPIIAQCTSEEEWDLMAPACNDIDECTDPTNTHNCDVNAKCKNTMGGFTCTCKRGYSGNGVICKPLTCEYPMAPANGEITSVMKDEYRVDDIITYKCNDGYRRIGAASRQCVLVELSAQWDSDEPTCEDEDECSPDDPNNRVCHEFANCRNIPGSFVCTCFDDYEGDGITDCKRIECELPSQLPQYAEHIEIIGGPFYVGHIIELRCFAGFQMTGGSGVIECSYDKQWRVDLTCEDIDECDVDFTKNPCGPNSICTNEIGSYSCSCYSSFKRQNGVCIEKLCPIPTPDPNGGFKIHSDIPMYRVPNGQIEYYCNAGYMMDDNGDATCTEEEVWDKLAPECKDVNECMQSDNLCDTTVSTCENLEGGYRCNCDEGYRTIDDFTCEEITCTVGPLSAHLSIDESYAQMTYYYMDTIKFVCATGYELTGSATRDCGANGWMGAMVSCRDINECNIGICDTNADCTNSDGSYTCECRRGYSGSGEKCEALTCEYPMAPANGEITSVMKDEYRLDDIVTYKCNDGYRRIGAASRQCVLVELSAQWDSDEPTCEDIDECDKSNPTHDCDVNADCKNIPGSFTCTCRENYKGDGKTCEANTCDTLGSIDNGKMLSDAMKFVVGATLAYECNSGFKFKAHGSVTCDAADTWSNVKPECIDIDECLEVRLPCEVNMVCRNTVGSYECSCKDDYKPNDSGPGCVEIICGDPPSIKSGSYEASPGKLVVGSTVTYSCDSTKYSILGESVLTCGNDGEWSPDAPLCVFTEEGSSFCKMAGDPHYTTFDGTYYDFMGLCTYTAVKTLEGLPRGMLPFNLEVENEGRFGRTDVSWLKRAVLTIADKTYEFDKGPVVTVDGVKIDYPYEDEYGIKIIGRGSKIILRSDFLTLRYDGDARLVIVLPSSYNELVEGLCGNYNNDENDDLIAQGEVEVAINPTVFGDSWRTDPLCKKTDHKEFGECTNKELYEAFDHCGYLQGSAAVETRDCFKTCRLFLSVTTFFTDCVKDACVLDGNREALEQSIMAYASDCQALNIDICDWRNDLGFPKQCGANQEYALCRTGCPNTCANPNAENEPCEEPCTEGCYCMEGYLWSGNECVRQEDCGCFENNQYYKNGKQFYTAQCQMYCECNNNVLTCNTDGCGSGEECTEDKNGDLFCKTACLAEPQPRPIMLPPDCLDDSGKTRFYDVKSCGTVRCPAKNQFEQTCCGIVASRKEVIQCNNGNGRSYSLHASVATQCGCGLCFSPTITVRGRVYGINEDGEEVPLALGNVFRQGLSATLTQNDGTFQLNVNNDATRLALTFVDQSGVLMTTTRVLDFKQLGGSIYHNIQIPMKAATESHQTQDDYSKRLGDMTVSIEKRNYFKKKIGLAYSGELMMRLTYINPSDAAGYLTAPGDFRTSGDLMLRSYGMFDCDIRDFRNNELDVENIKISIPTNNILVDSDRTNMRMWSLDPSTGRWHDEGDMQLNADGDALEGTISEIIDRRVINLDVASPSMCYVKVRAYGSNSFQQWDQRDGVKIHAVINENNVNGDFWRSSASGITQSGNGACLAVFCDYSENDGYYAIISATTDEDLSLVSGTRANDAFGEIFTSDSFKYTFPSRSSEDFINGPMYEDLNSCQLATYDENHFKFYMPSNAVYEFNSIPINEYNIYFTWRQDPLIWWPQPNEFTACYIKVKANGNNVHIRTVNTHGTNRDDMYGLRESVVENGAACVEFKCHGYYNEVLDLTHIEVSPRASGCVRSSVNDKLEDYHETQGTTQPQDSDAKYVFLAPIDNLGPTYGIYTHTDNDPLIAKEMARGWCYSGDLNINGKEMEPDKGVAITFTC